MFLAGCVLLASAASGARAGAFDIALDVSDKNGKQSAKTETEPPQAREVVVRPVMQSGAGLRCTAKWKLTCTARQSLQDVLVHFYVVRIDKAGQAPPPLDPKQVVIETAQTMDFSKGVATSAELDFLPDRPGIYLVRVETQGAVEATGHEQYAAMELVVH